ncbi:FAD-dependent monooxygenase [Mycolicibacterium neoaurum]|uniref:NAD(P)/FAD-dependent oxidoreductase n=1 Tax=Mycolicibacterium neoaurum TaxID=1795 RepID=UPI0026734A5F|nr:FAD-dependent monooxygenase [Mycolicibacterium neoaurum]MDO3401394.1 FAD-dependent monooxygenase [Mycolicibacterium neoaurum]
MTAHAVVLGAGIAGLLAAAALADSGHHVTIVERDQLPDSPSPRRGIPQGPHLHSVLSKGWQTIEDLVPGVLDDLVAAGAHVLDDTQLGARMHLQNGPYGFNRTDALTDPAALAHYLVTRPQLEYVLRRRVTNRPTVTIADGQDIGEFVVCRPGRISGVTVTDRQTGTTRVLDAELIVDASGRATRTPLLLEQLGYPRPPQRTFRVRGVYYSQHLAIGDQNSFPERLILVIPSGGTGRGGLIAGERGTWTLTIATHDDDAQRAPESLTDMLTRAESFMPAHVVPAIREARALSDIAVYRYPGGIWHRYDRAAHLPDGLLVVGDALCYLDPIHGQGITLAARHVHVLRAHLAVHGLDNPQAFYRTLAEIIAPVWATNRPPTAHRRSGITERAQRRALHWVRHRILAAAEDDIVITERLVRVVNMIDPPRRLFDPRILARVAGHHVRRALPSRDRKTTDSI